MIDTWNNIPQRVYGVFLYICGIIFSIEIYARKMSPIFSLRKRSLRGHDDLISIVSCNDRLSICKIQFRKDIVEKENNRKFEVLSQKENLDLLEREQKDLVLTS